MQGAHASGGDPVFEWTCRDILCSETAKVTRNGQSVMARKVDESLLKGLRGPQPRRKGGTSINPDKTGMKGQKTCLLPQE